MNSHALTEETKRTMSELIGQLLDQKNTEMTLALIGKNVRPDNEASFRQWLTTDPEPFNRSIPQTLINLLDHCETIATSQATQETIRLKKGATFLASVLLKHPTVLRKKLEARVNKILTIITQQDASNQLRNELTTLGLILRKIQDEGLPLLKITSNLFIQLCSNPLNDAPLLALHEYCLTLHSAPPEPNETIDWILQHTDQDALNKFKLSNKKTGIDTLLPTLATLLIHKETFEFSPALSEFYRITQEDIPLATKIIILTENMQGAEAIIATQALSTPAPETRKKAILMITHALCLRTRENSDLSRLYNDVKITNTCSPEIMNAFDQIEENVLCHQELVDIVMKSTIETVFRLSLEDVDQLFSNLSREDFLELFQWHTDNSDLEEKKLHLASGLIQNLLQKPTGIVLTSIHSKITNYIATHFGTVIRTKAEWFNPDRQETLYQQAKTQALRTMKPEGYERELLTDLEMLISAILEDSKELPLFLKQMIQLRFQQETPSDLINQAAERYIGEILPLKTKTGQDCKKFYNNHPSLSSLEKLQAMGDIAFQRTEKPKKSKYHEFYQQIASFRCSSNGTEPDNSSHSTGSWATQFTSRTSATECRASSLTKNS